MRNIEPKRIGARLEEHQDPVGTVRRRTDRGKDLGSSHQRVMPFLPKTVRGVAA